MNEMSITFCDRCGLLTHERKRLDGSILCDDCHEGKPAGKSHAADSQEMRAVTVPSPDHVLKTIQKNLKRGKQESTRS
jgi:hypothetical protein